MNSLSLRFKLILPIFFLMSSIFCIAQWFSFQKDIEQKEESLIERVHVLSKGVSYNLQAAILFDDQLIAQDILSAFAVDEDVVRVKLFDQENQLFALYEKSGSDAPIPNEILRKKALQNEYAISDQYIYLTVPIEIEGLTVASLSVTVSAKSLREIYETALNDALFFFTVLTLSGIALYQLVQKLIVKPVYSLNHAMKAYIDNRERNVDIDCKSTDEIGDLVSAFNTMLDTIEAHEEQDRNTLVKLEQEKSFANEVVDTVQHGLIVVNSNGEIIMSNGEASRVFHHSSLGLLGQNIIDILQVENDSIIDSALNEHKQLDEELIVRQNGNNTQQLLRVSSRPLSRPDQTLFAIEDVTEIEVALRRQRLAAGVFENSQDGIILLNHQGVITVINPKVTQLLGYSNEDVMNKPIDDVLAWNQFSSLLPSIEQSLEEFGQWQGEVWERHTDGHLVPLFAKVNRIAKSDLSKGQDMVIIISDLSNVKEMERLEYLAHHDSLTGLANRSKLYRVLNDIIAENQVSFRPFSLLYLDLDGFKQINDTYGHSAGDEVLKQVSERLLSQVRSQDLVARLSGDEFVIVINPSERESVELMSQRLIKLIEQDIQYKQHSVNVGASIGVYFIDSNEDSLDAMIKMADNAMYKAKNLGKGQFVLIDKSTQELM